MEARISALEEKVNDIIDGMRPVKFDTVKVLEKKNRLQTMVAEANALNKSRLEAVNTTFPSNPGYRQLRQDSDNYPDGYYGWKQKIGSGKKKSKKSKKSKKRKKSKKSKKSKRY